MCNKMISIISQKNRFVLYSDNIAVACCRYERNKLFPAEELCSEGCSSLLKNALYKTVLSYMENCGYEDALCDRPDAELFQIGFDKNGKLSLKDFFGTNCCSCSECNDKAM